MCLLYPSPNNKASQVTPGQLFFVVVKTFTFIASITAELRV